MELEVIFDREDRTYRSGEIVSGKVVLKPFYDRTFTNIWVTCRWQTHGQGSRDNGRERKVILVEEKTFLKAGECMEFSFYFEAPNGPVTYHGHLLNVDWYLTAHARGGFQNPIETQQIFLLQACDPNEAVILGNKEIPPEEFPVRSIQLPPSEESILVKKTYKPKNLLKWVIIIFSLIFSTYFCIWSGFKIPISINYKNLEQEWYLIPVFLASFFLFYLSIVGFSAQKLSRIRFIDKLEPGEVWVKPVCVWRGGIVRCHLDFISKRDFYLRNISASISAWERVTAPYDGEKLTSTNNLGEKVYTQDFNQDVSQGRRVRFACDLPVHPDAPATFFSNNNHLEWTVTMNVKIKGWPHWEKTLPITVLP